MIYRQGWYTAAMMRPDVLMVLGPAYSPGVLPRHVTLSRSVKSDATCKGKLSGFF